MKEETLKTVIEVLQKSKQIAIVGHKNPDGDAVGSCLGLFHFLKNRGFNVKVVMPNDFPDFLKWLPGCDTILNFEKHLEEVTTVIENAEVIFT